MSYFTHRFDTRVVRLSVGARRHTVVLLDPRLHHTLPRQQSRPRLEAEVGGVPIKGAWQPSQGRWYLMLPAAAVKAGGLAIGDLVTVAWRLSSPDDVDVPEELARRLAAVKALGVAWAELTPGARRGLAHFIESVKRPGTRAARLLRVEAALLGKVPLPWARNTRPPGRGARGRPAAPSSPPAQGAPS